MQNRSLVIPKRRPHDPPAIVDTLDQTAVWTRATVKWIRSGTFGFSHGINPEGPLYPSRAVGAMLGLALFSACFESGGGPLLVQQISFSHGDECSQPFLPLLGDSSRILSSDNRIKRRLIHKQLRHPFHLEVVGIELVQRRRQFNSQF